jgi:hypothetical protein
MTTLDEKVAALKAANKAGVKAAPKKPAAAKPKPAVKRVATRPNKQAEKDQAFAHAYVRHGCNGAAAYRECYPNCKPAGSHVGGSKMLRKATVQRVLEPLLEALMQKNQIDTEFVISRILEQANASPLDYFEVERGAIKGIDVGAINDAQRRNLRSIKMTENSFVDKHGNEHSSRSWHITVVDQQKAIEMFAKYLQMFTKSDELEDDARIGDLITLGVKRIREHKSLQAGVDAIEGVFSEVER